MSRTIGFEPAPNGAILTVDGKPFTTITLVGDGTAEVTLPSADQPDIKVVREAASPSGAKSIDESDPNYVRYTHSAMPDFDAPRLQPDSNPATATPSGMTPLRGQEDAEYHIGKCLADGESALLLGPTGCGKTHSVRLAAQRHGYSFVMASIQPDTTSGDLIGEAVVSPSSMGSDNPLVWNAGPVEVAVRQSLIRPTVLVLDEANRIAKTSVFASLYPVLDGSKMLTLPGGEQIPVGNLIVFATANPADDAKTQYEVRELDPAFADRFGTTLSFTYPDPKVECIALCEAVVGLDSDVALRLCETAASIRQSPDISYPFGFRTLASWGKKVAFGIDIATAAEVTFVPKAPVEDREAIRTYITAMHVR